MKVLQISAHFYPNIGGVETHLSNLVFILIKRNWKVSVLTYKPLTTNVSSKIFEKNQNLKIIRIPWFPGFFYKLVHYPIVEFLYLLPGLFLAAPFLILLDNPDVIHAQGLVAGFVAVFWGKVFDKKTIISTHSIYSFPNNGIYREFAKFIFKNSNFCMGLSKQAAKEIESLGINPSKVINFTYWIDLKKFKKVNQAKEKLGWKEKFVVLFVGRLVPEKGIQELLESVKKWNKNIKLKIIGSGPLEDDIRAAEMKISNIEFIERIDSNNLPIYYSGSDLLIVPSVSEEGFGRVIIEALGCGTPVVGSNRGAIPEALDNSVGKLIDIDPENIKKTVHYFYQHRDELKNLSKNCREFAERRYSEKNAETIIKAYQS